MRPSAARFNLSTGGGLLAIVLWSTTIAMARSLSEQLGPLTAGAAVYLVAGLFCLVRLLQSKTSIRQMLSLPRKYLLGCGCLFALCNVLLFLAVGLARDREQVLEIGLINYLWPASTILLSLPLLNKRANLWLIPGTALALAGVFLVMTQGARVSCQSFAAHLAANPAAYACAFGAALTWALYSNLARRWSGAGGDGAAELFIPATGLVLLLIRCVSPESSVWNAPVVVEAVVLGGITAVAYVCWDAAMRKGDLVFVAACSYFTPLLSTLVSCAYLKVTPGWQLWTGCVVMVIGSLVSWRSLSENQMPGANLDAARYFDTAPEE
jgi:drug/metabolite transporter (DMT)-like permease